MTDTNKVIAIIGPTSTGKTALGVKIAREVGGEIISADSRQVYRYLDIGTGKDLDEYSVYNGVVKYHLIDILSPRRDRYNVKQFIVDAKNIISDIHNRHKIPIIVGGSMLYVNALIFNYSFNNFVPNDEIRKVMKYMKINEILQYAKEILNIKRIFTDNLSNRHRLIRNIEMQLYNGNLIEKKNMVSFMNYEWLILTPLFERERIYLNAEKRLYDRILNGLIDEVRKLHEYYNLDWNVLDSFGLEYRYISKYLKQELNFCQMIEQLIVHIKKFIKTQELWINNMIKRGVIVNKVETNNDKMILNLINDFINNNIENGNFITNNIDYSSSMQYKNYREYIL